jgi:hypothetical protein
MKDVHEITACVVDYGYNVSLAEHLAETFAAVYYSSPCQDEFVDVRRTVFGDGLSKVERLDDPFEPDILKTIDLFIFPDIGMAGTQKYLRSIGKAVWGSFDATDKEIYRTEFLEWLKEMDLPISKYVKIRGVTALADHLKTVKDKWVKIDRYRAQKETWKHIDYAHSQSDLEDLARMFGGMKEHVVFVVQDTIPTEIEIGYDGDCVDSNYAESSFQGYEGKNNIYLGSHRKYEQLPKQVRQIMDAMKPDLAQWGYRNQIAAEIRLGKDGKPYFIDPTMRMPGQTGEQLQVTCKNLPQRIWMGANGIMVKPEWAYKFAVSATIHYDAGPDDGWKAVALPEPLKKWAKLARYCEADGLYHFPPSPSRELGVLLGAGNSIPAAFASLRKNVDAFSSEPVSFEMDGFFDLLDSIRAAEKKGMIFSDDPIPTKEQILKFTM